MISPRTFVKEISMRFPPIKRIILQRDTLLKERNALAGERDALLDERNALTKERDVLSKKYNELVKEREALFEEYNALIKQLADHGIIKIDDKDYLPMPPGISV